MFTTHPDEIRQRVDSLDPIGYGKTRNYLDGSVTRLSPYISRGVLTTRQVAKEILAKGYKPNQIEPFLRELAWRDYFQQVWTALGDKINTDIKHLQPRVRAYEIPVSVVNHTTGIQAVDDGIRSLYHTGYLHNHVRMYVASIACNVAQCHWLPAARWLYYHLLDADWASNALSWQWVAGSFSSKKYVANQENINRYCYSNQHHTFLDVPYEAFDQLDIPEVLTETTALNLKTILPTAPPLILDEAHPVYLYNFYNLDWQWGASGTANRVLLLEPSFFETFPVCDRTLQFVLDLATNIPAIQLFVGEFQQLRNLCTCEFHFKEHPTNRHYAGVEHPRDWMFPNVTGYFPSFFAYWKKCSRVIHEL